MQSFLYVKDYITSIGKEEKTMDEMMKNMSEEFSIEEVENVEALSEESMWYVIGAGTFVLVGICAC
jgi:fructoselysine-6-P-deglycase FrlB-like protein